MGTELTTKQDQANALAAILEAGEQANEAAARSAFADYRSRKSRNTLRRHDADLALFALYLAETIPDAPTPTSELLASTPEAWQGITWGLVEGFARWMLLQGYAIASINARLSAVKIYAKLAAKAGALAAEDLAMIRTVSGYSRKEGKRIDEKRDEADISTRTGHKKPEPVSLTVAQASDLKDHPDTPQGRRDRLLMCLLLDHGLRVGEVAGLAVGAVDLKAGELTFYREKVDRIQTHRLTQDALQVARAYLEQDALAIGPLLRASRRGGKLAEHGMSARAITKRVHFLGQRLGIEGLSAHDCRHFWATDAARNNTPMDRLQDAGGWASLAMPARYIEAAKIANQGVKLSEAKE